MTLDELKQLIVARLDPIEFLDALNMSMFELVEKFEDEVMEDADKLRRLVDD